LSPTAVMNEAIIAEEHELVTRRQATADGSSGLVSVVKRSDGARRHGAASNGTEEVEVVYHDVSERGAARRSVGERNASPMSIIWPPQMGHKSIR
jgi:putative transposon-encoded protein